MIGGGKQISTHSIGGVNKMICLRFAAALSLTLILAYSCDNERSEQARVNKANTYIPMNESESKISTEWEKLKSYTFTEKKKALEEYRDSLDRLDAKIDDLEAKINSKAENIEMNTRELWKESAEILRDKRAKLAEVYNKMRSATQENWKEVQSSFESNWNELEERWESSRQAE